MEEPCGHSTPTWSLNWPEKAWGSSDDRSKESAGNEGRIEKIRIEMKVRHEQKKVMMTGRKKKDFDDGDIG